MEERVEEIQESAFAVSKWTREILQNWGVSSSSIDLVNLIVQLAIVLIFVFVFQWIARRLIIFILKQLRKLPKMQIAEHLQRHRFPAYLALVAPFTWIRSTISIVFENYPNVISGITKTMDLFIILMIFWLISSFLKALSMYLLTLERYKDKPMESYFQVIRIIVAIFCIGAAFTVLSGKSIASFFTAMGAASAVMMLVFKDTILGFVTSIQVSTNDMIRIGDWISMPKYNADGDVFQITLTTVKVQNFDKTISTIPTYALISDSFQNWRGMRESGGRRIKRAILLKQSTFRYIEDNEIERFKKIQLISDYIDERQDDINEFNTEIGADRSLRVNGRNLTNVGLYRKYAENYLKNHPNVNKDMNIMVRQLAPNEFGLPMEIYCFSNTVIWNDYEAIMADIFDHLISAVRYFDLKVFENLSDSGPEQ